MSGSGGGSAAPRERLTTRSDAARLTIRASESTPAVQERNGVVRPCSPQPKLVCDGGRGPTSTRRRPPGLIPTLESGMGREDRHWSSLVASRTVASHRAATESRRLF